MTKNRKSTIGIVLHHSVTSPNIAQGTLRNIFTKRFNVDYIGYNVCINAKGETYSDIGDDGVGIHNNEGKYTNANSVGVCLLGDFSKNKPTKAQLDKLRSELDRLRKKYGIPLDKLFGHRNFKATYCPSDIIYNWLEEYKKGEEDMYTDKSGVFNSKPRSAEEWYNSAILYRNKLIKADSENKARIGALEDAQEALKKELKDIRQDRDNITDTLVEYGEQIDYWNSLTPVELILKGLKSLFKRK